MIIEVKDRETYVPEFKGNANLGEDAQIRVHYRYPKPGERARFFGMNKDMDVRTDDKGNTSTQPTFRYDPAGLVKLIVTRIENLRVGKTDVTTGAMLYDTPGVPSALISEIENAIMNAEPEVDEDFLE